MTFWEFYLTNEGEAARRQAIEYVSIGLLPPKCYENPDTLQGEIVLAQVRGAYNALYPKSDE